MMTLLKALSQNNQQTSNGYNLSSNSEKLFNELDSVANNTVGKFIEVDTKDKSVKSRIENAVEQASKKYTLSPQVPRQAGVVPDVQLQPDVQDQPGSQLRQGNDAAPDQRLEPQGPLPGHVLVGQI